MKLFSVCDGMPVDWREEEELGAFWADDAAGAEKLWRDGLRRRGEYAHPDEAPASVREYAAPCPPAEDVPHEERRPAVLRLLGWRQEDERACEVCDLYPFGLSECAVCEECGVCGGCMAAGFGVCCGVCGPDIDDEDEAEFTRGHGPGANRGEG